MLAPIQDFLYRVLNIFLPKKPIFSNDTSKCFFFRKNYCLFWSKMAFFCLFWSGGENKTIFFKVFQMAIMRIYMGAKPPTMLPMDKNHFLKVFQIAFIFEIMYVGPLGALWEQCSVFNTYVLKFQYPILEIIFSVPKVLKIDQNCKCHDIS